MANMAFYGDPKRYQLITKGKVMLTNSSTLIKLSLAVLLVLFSIGAVQTCDGTKRGTIRDKYGNPISGVTVTVTLADTDDLVVQVSTDSAGTYNTPLVDGAYKITPSRSGYMFIPDSKTVVIEDGTVSMRSLDGRAVPSQIVSIVADSIDFEGEQYQCAKSFFNPAAWTTEPGDPDNVQGTNNCYSYAANVFVDVEGQLPDPGYAGGYDLYEAWESGFYTTPCGALIDAAVWDGLEYMEMSSEPCPDNKSKVALFVAPTPDPADESFAYHWYRQETSGFWTHKMQEGVPVNYDFWGWPIWNVEWRAPVPVLSEHCGYFCACSSAEQGGGHERAGVRY